MGGLICHFQVPLNINNMTTVSFLLLLLSLSECRIFLSNNPTNTDLALGMEEWRAVILNWMLTRIILRFLFYSCFHMPFSHDSSSKLGRVEWKLEKGHRFHVNKKKSNNISVITSRLLTLAYETTREIVKDAELIKLWNSALFCVVRVDCVGILKLRNADVEARIGIAGSKKKSTRARLVFRVNITRKDGSTLTLQTPSSPILCSECQTKELRVEGSGF